MALPTPVSMPKTSAYFTSVLVPPNIRRIRRAVSNSSHSHNHIKDFPLTKNQESYDVDWHPNWQLQSAIVQSNTDGARKAFADGAQVNYSEVSGGCPLHRVAYRGDVAMCRLLLGKRAALDSRNTIGQTALHVAAMRWRPAVVLLLLRSKAQADVTDCEGATPARAAVAGVHDAGCCDVRNLVLCLTHLAVAYKEMLETLQSQPRHEVMNEPLRGTDRPHFDDNATIKQLSMSPGPGRFRLKDLCHRAPNSPREAGEFTPRGMLTSKLQSTAHSVVLAECAMNAMRDANYPFNKKIAGKQHSKVGC